MSTEIEGLREFITDLGRIESAALRDTDAVIKRSAQALEDAYTEQAAGSAHFSSKRKASVDRSISYDSDYRIGQSAYEIGPDKGRGGKIANIAYFGGANGGGGTLDLDGPFKKEEGRLMFALDQFLGGVIG